MRPFNPRVTGAAGLAVLLLLGPAFAASARAQSSVELPVSLVIPNYDRTLIGQAETLESGAFVARANNPVAVYYNPAGLALVHTSQITVGASTHEWVRYSVEGESANAGRRTGRSIGGVFGVALGKPPFASDRWRVGLLVGRPVSWQPALEVQVRRPASGGAETTSYITINSVSDFMPTVAAAYLVSPTLRVGASAGLSFFGMYQNRSLFSDLVTPSALTLAESTFFSDGTTHSLMFAGGVQWDATPTVRVGATVAAPSWRLDGTASLIYRGALSEGSASRVATANDARATFRYKQPLKLCAGVAWRAGRAALEFDIRHHASAGTYAVYASGQPVSVVTAGAGGTVETTEQFPDLTYTSRAVTNVAAGGRFMVAEFLTVHGGFFTDRTPVADGRQPVFFPLNIVGATAGVSLQIRGLSGSVGLVSLRGRSTLKLQSQGGVTVTPEIGVHSFGLTYSVSYTF